MWHVWKTGEVHTGFWWGDLRERDHLKDLDIDEKIIIIIIIIIKYIFKKWDMEPWTASIWIRIGTGGGLL
jgi:hypothetical protein